MRSKKFFSEFFRIGVDIPGVGRYDMYMKRQMSRKNWIRKVQYDRSTRNIAKYLSKEKIMSRTCRDIPHKWEIGDHVGFENDIWEVCGLSLRVGYSDVGWTYNLISVGWVADGYAKGKRDIREDAIQSYQSVVDARKAAAQAEIDKYTALAEQAKESLKKLTESA